LRREFWGHFRELADRGKTIILSTHSFDEARYCDTLGFLRQGIVTAVGGIGEILSQAGTTDLEEAYIRFVPREGGDR
jgi:ABC-type multidrug transport system ATPase subunit